MVADFSCDSVQLLLACVPTLPRPFLFKSWDDVDMDVEYHLTCGGSIVLKDAYAICVRTFLDSISDFLHNFEEGCQFFIWNLMDVLMMVLGNDKGMSFIRRSDVQESHCSLVFVDTTRWQLVSHYFAEGAVFSQGIAPSTLQRLIEFSPYENAAHFVAACAQSGVSQVFFDFLCKGFQFSVFGVANGGV